MFDITTIQGIAVGSTDSLVNWEQSSITGSVVVADKLKTSRSGLSLEAGSRIVSVRNVQETMEDPDANDAAVNTELEKISKQAFVNVVSSLFNEEDYLSGGLLFKHESDQELLTLPVNHFVGYEIDTCQSNIITAIINRLLIEFGGANTVKILLFNSHKTEPIYSKEVTTVAMDVVEEEVNWLLSNYKYGGKFYLGYLTASVSEKPIKREFEAANIQSYFSGVAITAIRVAHTTETMFDVNDIENVSETWGVNFDLQIYDDRTLVVKANQRRFARALQLRVAIDVADLMLHSVRSNRIERIAKSAIVYELNGNQNDKEMPEHIGLYKQFDNEINRLKNTFNPTGNYKATLC